MLPSEEPLPDLRDRNNERGTYMRAPDQLAKLIAASGREEDEEEDIPTKPMAIE